MVHEGFIAVHLGAGKHSKKSEAAYKNLSSVVCQKGSSLLQEGQSALDVTCQALSWLEDDPLTNAGYGSNLNENGEVECDAGIMSSLKETKQTQFGAVSVLKQVKNPILVAKEIISYQNEPRLLGRTPPLLLVGEGALSFAKNRGLSLINNTALISEQSMKKYTKYKSRLEASKAFDSNGFKLTVLEHPQSQDTVGVICIDNAGNIASASSSGGIALKLPGRVGQSSIYGCGCWAQHSESAGVAVVTSGCGEQLIQTTLAKTIGQAILERGEPAFHLKDLMYSEFVHSAVLADEAENKMGGVLVAYYDPIGQSVDFSLSYTTESMVVGYMTTGQAKASVRVSRNASKADQCTVGSGLTIEGFILKI